MTTENFTPEYRSPVGQRNALRYANEILLRIESLHALNEHFENYQVDIDLAEVHSQTHKYITALTSELRFALDMARSS